MRRTVVTALTALTLTAGSTAGGAEPVWPAKVQGYNVTAEGARKDAVKEAVRQLSLYVRHLDPPLQEWQPTEEFVEKNLLSGDGIAAPLNKIGDTRAFSWTFDLKKPDVEQLRRLDRQALGGRLQAERQLVAADRTIIAGGVFGGLLVVMSLTLAYKNWQRSGNGRKPIL